MTDRMLCAALPEGLEGVYLTADLQIHLSNARVFQRIALVNKVESRDIQRFEPTEDRPWAFQSFHVSVGGRSVTVFCSERPPVRDLATVVAREDAPKKRYGFTVVADTSYAHDLPSDLLRDADLVIGRAGRVLMNRHGPVGFTLTSEGIRDCLDDSESVFTWPHEEPSRAA